MISPAVIAKHCSYALWEDPHRMKQVCRGIYMTPEYHAIAVTTVSPISQVAIQAADKVGLIANVVIVERGREIEIIGPSCAFMAADWHTLIKDVQAALRPEDRFHMQRVWVADTNPSLGALMLSSACLRAALAQDSSDGNDMFAEQLIRARLADAGSDFPEILDGLVDREVAGLLADIA